MLGKPAGQDEEHNRPSSARELGLSGAVQYFDELVSKAIGSIPNCKGDVALKMLVAHEAERLLPAAWFANDARLITAGISRMAA
jgi:geranylgeranyl diphosphate synthase type II